MIEVFKAMQDYENGITPEKELLRDYFAGKALHALIINCTLLPKIADGWANSLAKEAYKMADGMMKEREIK
ncbi:hypothetical protein [Xenorhabdus sp. SGI246]|uniref:hypothetical protein n=1 Tax=Xenorhabdus sp. SGI246 TaxID=3158263 RepID=UPI00349FBED8